MRHALVTGAAGFIGSHLVDGLLADGWQVTAVDSFDPFYPREAKERNIAAHLRHAGYRLFEVDIRDLDAMRQRLHGNYAAVVHLAARVGVRPSTLDPLCYHDVNVRGTHNVLELARELRIPQVVFASSSSVYGLSPNVPWREEDPALPISPYASSKVSGELLGHVYSHLHGLRFVALRLPTVYGPRQRPDAVIHKFAQRMVSGQRLAVFGDGSTRRDVTFVTDIVSGIRGAMDYRRSRFEVVNLGNTSAVTLTEMIDGLQDALDVRAAIDWQPEQPGHVAQAMASIDKARRLLRYDPKTPFAHGIAKFADWLAGVPSAELSAG